MAGKLGLTTARIARIREFENLLGVQSDGEVGRRANVDAEIVRMYRFNKGILRPGEVAPQPEAPPKRVAKGPKGARAERSPIAAFADRLGTMTDVDLARLAGATPAAVGQFRRRKGIAAFEPHPPEPEPEPVAPPKKRASPPAAPAEPQVEEPAPKPAQRPEARATAFIVKVLRGESEKDYVVVERDLAGAARRAVDAVGAGGHVVAVTRHIEAIG